MMYSPHSAPKPAERSMATTPKLRAIAALKRSNRPNLLPDGLGCYGSVPAGLKA